MPEAVKIPLTKRYDRPVLALGSQTRNRVCALRDDEALLSEEHADLDDGPTYRRFLENVRRMGESCLREGGVVACDLHPTYASSRHARSLGRRTVEVQHHFAHAASCAVDAGFEFPVVGIVCDGTGWGADGTIWGGEVLLCDPPEFQRLAHLRTFALPGGDAAIRAPWRTALAAIDAVRSEGACVNLPPTFAQVRAAELELVQRQMRAGLYVPRTSSLGRLLDAAAFLLGVCPPEPALGQAPMLLEREAGDVSDALPYPFETRIMGSTMELDWTAALRAMLDEQESGAPANILSARFHATMVEMFASSAAEAAQQRGAHRVVLSGGCFLNVRLREGIVRRMRSRGIQVAVHQRVSTGDAGLALGQAVVAAYARV
ncbi:MAG: carbamoyltransferase HypF [Phycisphaerales bacterium]|nr:carbamoyltransferase HypF [Phycisphaerales bacterium]